MNVLPYDGTHQRVFRPARRGYYVRPCKGQGMDRDDALDRIGDSWRGMHGLRAVSRTAQPYEISAGTADRTPSQ